MEKVQSIDRTLQFSSPSFEFQPVDWESIPACVKNDIEIGSKLNADMILEKHVHPDRTTSYFFSPMPSNEPEKHEAIYIVDERDDIVSGYVYLRFDSTQYAPMGLKGVPFTQMTKTYGEGRAGDAKRRMVSAHHVALRRYGMPLHSGAMRRTNMRLAWEKLEQEGLAKLVKNIEGIKFYKIDSDK